MWDRVPDRRGLYRTTDVPSVPLRARLIGPALPPFFSSRPLVFRSGSPAEFALVPAESAAASQDHLQIG